MDVQQSHSSSKLRDLLQIEYLTLCQYVELAEQENDALAESDPESIAILADQKLKLLNQLTCARDATKLELGEPISVADLGDRLRMAGPGTREVFELILAKAREAMEINRITARLIAHQTRRLQQRQAAISGAGINPVDGYGVTGFQNLRSGYGSIGRA